MEIVPPESILKCCIDGDFEQFKNIYELDNPDLNSKEDDDSLLLITINNFIEKVEYDGNSTPKYFENSYIKIIIFIIQKGITLDSESIHLCLFNDKPIFTLNDFIRIVTDEENDYPLHNALELVNICNENAEEYDCFKKEYEYLSRVFNDYSVNILDHCRNIDEAKEVMLLIKNNRTTIDIAYDKEIKEYISHKYVQTEFENKWYGITKDYDTFTKIIYSIFPFFIDNYYQWYSSPCIKYYLHTLFNCIFLILLQLQTNTLTSKEISNMDLLIYLWVFGMYLVEIEQINYIGFSKYISDEWNKFDIILLTNYLITFVLRLVVFFMLDDYNQWLIYSEHLFVVNIILSYIRILNICQIHPVLGPILLMIGKMMSDMILFFSILFIFFTGFTLGMTKVYHRVGEEHAMGTINNTLITLICALFGDFDMDMFKVEQYPQIETFGIIVFFIYMIVSIIILVNLFIAILSNTYSVIQEDSDIEWKYSRVCLISNYNIYTLTPPPINILEYIYKKILIFVSPSKKIEPYYIDTPESQNKNIIRKIVLRRKRKMNDLDTNNEIKEIKNRLDILSSHILSLIDLIVQK